MPPFQTPDEYNHFYRTYTVSQGDFTVNKQNQRLGGMVPVSFQDFLTPFSAANADEHSKMEFCDFSRSFTVACEPDYAEFKDFPNTCYYSGMAYLPQALMVFIGIKLNVSVGTLFYTGRLFGFLFWLLGIYWAIKITPIGKWLFVALNLLPMQLYISNSFSADNITNLLAFILVALVLRSVLTERKVGIKTALVLIAVASGLALTKSVYVFLVLMVFLTPQKKFAGNKRWLAYTIVVSVIPVIIAFWWSQMLMQNYLSYADYNPEYRHLATIMEGADYNAQRNFLENNPLQIIRMFIFSLSANPGFYLTSYVGHFGSFMDSPLSITMVVLAFAGIILVASIDLSEYGLTKKQKVALVLIGLFVLFFVILSQYLTWSKLGDAGVDIWQGRYLFPIMVLFVFVFTNQSKHHKWNMPVFVLPLVVVLNYSALNTLYKRYIKEDSRKKNEVFFDFENKGSVSAFSVNAQIRDTIAVSGSKALQLLPGGSYAINPGSDKPKKNDWILFEAMVKGNGAKLYISGIKHDTQVFNYVAEYPRYKTSNGWAKLKFAQGIENETDSVKMFFYLVNEANETVLFDDVRLLHKMY